MVKRRFRKKVFTGFTTRHIGCCWTFGNTLNLAAVVQKTRQEAMARYDDYPPGNQVMKVRITIEEVKDA